MSGDGVGYFRFPCCWMFEYNCSNWVWQNLDACADCQAAGRGTKRDAGYVSETKPANDSSKKTSSKK